MNLIQVGCKTVEPPTPVHSRQYRLNGIQFDKTNMNATHIVGCIKIRDAQHLNIRVLQTDDSATLAE
jgi:hypothetical protein